MPTGTLYLLPVPLSPDTPFKWTEEELHVLKSCKVFIAENLKTMRRFVRAGGSDISFDDVVFFEMEKHRNYFVDRQWITHVKEGKDVVLTSEAGCPCIGDPGFSVVMAAHKEGIRVKPMSAKSAMTLALMGCGLNAQAYTFHGYLPVDTPGFQKKVRDMQQELQRTRHTHVFIETPYRNNSMLEKFLALADDRSMLCIASNLQSETESIQTQSVKYWKRNIPALHKSPVVYVWGTDF